MSNMISRDGGKMTLEVALALSFGNKAWTMPAEGTIIVVQRFPPHDPHGAYVTDAWVISLSDHRIFPANRADLPRGAIWLPLELLSLPPTALDARIARLRTVHEEHSREVLRDDLDAVEKGYYLRQYAQAVEELLDCVDAQAGQETRGTSMDTESLSMTPITDTPIRFANIGDEVGYVLPGGPSKGQTRPAKIVRIWDEKLVNLVVFTDGGNDFPTGQGSQGILWVTNAGYSDGYQDGNTWHWLAQDTPFIPAVTQPQDVFASA